MSKDEIVQRIFARYCPPYFEIAQECGCNGILVRETIVEMANNTELAGAYPETVEDDDWYNSEGYHDVATEDVGPLVERVLAKLAADPSLANKR